MAKIQKSAKIEYQHAYALKHQQITNYQTIKYYTNCNYFIA